MDIGLLWALRIWILSACCFLLEANVVVDDEAFAETIET